MVVAQCDIWRADLPEPVGSEPGYRRPVVVVQSDRLNRSSIPTILCAPLTTSFNQAQAPGNVVLESAATGLPKTSVANVSQLVTVDRRLLLERCGAISESDLTLIIAGINLVLGA